MSILGKVFDSDLVKDVQLLKSKLSATGVLDDVGTTAYTPQGLAVQDTESGIKVYDATANFDASATAAVSILGQGGTIAPFEKGSPLSAPSGSSWAQLEVTGSVSGGITGTTPVIPLSVSASGAAKFTFDHWLPAAATAKRIDALAKLLSTAQVPQYESLTGLADNEISRIESTLNFDLGIKGTYGTSFDLAQTISLFDGLSAQIKATVQYSIEAHLGWSIFDDIQVTVGKAQQANGGWVRVRIERSHSNTFTVGAIFALQINYDASSLADVLEQAFQMSPLSRAISILNTAATISFDDLKQKVTTKAADELISAIAGTGWKEKAADDPVIVAALADINKVVSTYKSVDAKVQQLWDKLLTRVDLGPDSDLRKTIEKIAALNPADPDLDQFLPAGAQKDLEMLESLTGVDIEQLIIGSNAAVANAITKAVSLAQQLLSIINGTPSRIDAAIADFADKYGIKSAITFLANNATSLDQIEAFGDNAIKTLVGKAVDKLFDGVVEADFDKVQAWAKKLLAQWDALTQKLTAAAKFLKGQLGFSVALEFSRVSESSALLDCEVDPANGDAVDAVQKQLPSGSVADMLAALNKLSSGYEIRDALLVSRHSRTGVTTVIFSILGLQNLQKITGTRFDESTVQIKDAGRVSSFSGGFVETATNRTTAEGGAWIAIDAASASKDPDDPYDSASPSLHVTFSHNSTSSTPQQREALEALIDQLGFAGPVANVTAPDGSETAFSMTLVLDAPALQSFVADTSENDWSTDFRNAGYRLFNDALVPDTLFNNGPRIGTAEAVVVKSDQFGTGWRIGLQNVVDNLAAQGIAINGHNLNIISPPIGGPRHFVSPYIPVMRLIIQRPAGLQKLVALKNALGAAAGNTPKQLRDIARAAAVFFSTTNVEYDDPMFNFWFVVARISRMGIAGKGLATFRSRTSSTADFSAPTQWQASGVPVAQLQPADRLAVFPF